MRSLLAYMPTYPRPVRPEFAVSVAAVAERLDARIRAVTTDPVFHGASNWALSDVLNGLTHEAAESASAHALTCRRAVDAAAASRGHLDHRSIRGDPQTFQRAMERWSRVHDLTVVELADDDPELGVAEAVVFDSRRPLLVLPASLPEVFSPRRIVIAWDGSAAAARALGEALPWLSGVAVVELVSVQEDDKPQEIGSRSEDAADYLKAHGFVVETLELKHDGRNVDDVLFDHAGEIAADMVVMGAYGHSRIREFVLGGVTRRALCKPRVPMLMAH